jgi:hypothetical protein
MRALKVIYLHISSHFHRSILIGCRNAGCETFTSGQAPQTLCERACLSGALHRRNHPPSNILTLTYSQDCISSPLKHGRDYHGTPGACNLYICNSRRYKLAFILHGNEMEGIDFDGEEECRTASLDSIPRRAIRCNRGQISVNRVHTKWCVILQ